MEKVAFGVQALISQTGKIGAWLLLRINSTCFRSVAKSTILNDLIWALYTISKHVRRGVVTIYCL